MRYVPTRPGEPTTPVPTPLAGVPAAVRQAVRELRTLAERRAWASRAPFRNALRPASGAPAGPARESAAEVAARVGVVLADLEAATVRYVCTLRAEGARPEQMLVRVKACVREAMEAERWQDPDAAQVLTAEVVGWSIAAYYDR